MKNVTEIIGKYTAGEATLVETNLALEAAGASVRLDIQKNSLTEEERNAAQVGGSPELVNGWGLLDTGTGSLDKVLVKNGRLVDCHCGQQFALFLIGGHTYEVKGDALAGYGKY